MKPINQIQQNPWIRLMRFDKPIGIYLLLWPTYWGLWFASNGQPSLNNLFIFTLGVIVMRAAGCVINDYADRHVDGKVERTRHRPIPSGEIEPWQALTLFFVLLLVALGLVAATNILTVQLAIVGTLLAACYPFLKRITHLPQLGLGVAWAWAIPMAFAAEQQALPDALWLIVVAIICWTVAFDTYYAMVDRDDDLKTGIKSTAILFGELDRRIIALMQVASIGCFVACGQAFALDTPYYLAISGVAAMFIWHQWLIKDRAPEACFVAFNQSKWIGVIVLAGLVAQFTLFST